MEEEARLLLGTSMWNADLILTQLQDKHKEPHWTHTLKWLLPLTEPLVVSLLSSMVSRLAKPGWGPERSVLSLLALPTVSSSYLPIPRQQSHHQQLSLHFSA